MLNIYSFSFIEIRDIPVQLENIFKQVYSYKIYLYYDHSRIPF